MKTKPNKNESEFDCLKFKDEAQKRIYEETKGLTPEQEREYFRRSAETGPYSELWKQIAARNPSKERIG